MNDTPATQQTNPPGARATEQTRDVPVYVPQTDIYETAEAVVVLADMPGVDEKHVDVQLENNVLTLTGHVVPEPPEGHELVYREFVPGDYQRSFTLSETVDRNGIRARMTNGVLRVTLAKTKEAQPRRIAVEAGS